MRHSFRILQLLTLVSRVGTTRQVHLLQVASMTGHAANRMQIVHSVNNN